MYTLYTLESFVNPEVNFGVMPIKVYARKTGNSHKTCSLDAKLFLAKTYLIIFNQI